jgi:hypothetical protein
MRRETTMNYFGLRLASFVWPALLVAANVFASAPAILAKSSLHPTI